MISRNGLVLETENRFIGSVRTQVVHSQILLSVFVEAWVRKYSFYLTDTLGEHLTHLSAFDTEMINHMALGLPSQNPGRKQLGSDSPALKRISQSRSKKG